MTSSKHQLFGSTDRDSQSLCNDRCQNILYKAVFEHFIELDSIAALVLTSKSFQNSSFGANFLVNFVLEKDVVGLLESVLSPSSCFSLQFVPSLYIRQSAFHSQVINRGISNFVGELANTKYLRLSLGSLTLDNATKEVASLFLGTSCNAWPQLQQLSLEGCGIDDEVLEIIAKKAVQLRSVNVAKNRYVTDAGLEQLSELSGITSLDLSNCNKITDVGLEPISKLGGITSLNLSHCCHINDVGMGVVAQLSGITSLNLRGCEEITDAGLEHLSKLSDITSLYLSSCFVIADAGLEHLSKLTRITSLDLSSCNQITDAGLEHLSKLSGITSLNLSRCFFITDAGLEHIAKLTNITSLNLSSCFFITDAGLEHIAKLTNITSLVLSYCNKITDVGLEHIVKLTNITSLNLMMNHCCRITTKAKQKLQVALPNCRIGNNPDCFC